MGKFTDEFEFMLKSKFQIELEEAVIHDPRAFHIDFSRLSRESPEVSDKILRAGEYFPAVEEACQKGLSYAIQDIQPSCSDILLRFDNLPRGIGRNSVDLRYRGLCRKIQSIRLSNEKPMWMRNQEVFDLLLNDLFSKKGDFYKTRDRQVFWFDKVEKTLYMVPSEEFSSLLGRLKINAEDPLLKWIVSSLRDFCLDNGELVAVHQLSWFDGQKLYLSNSESSMFVLDGKSIRAEDNGFNGVLFGWRQDWQQWSRIEPTEDGLFDKYVLRYLEIEKGEYQPQAQKHSRSLVKAWFYYRLFARQLHVILAFLGEKGSSKTTVARLIGRLVLGPSFEVSSIEKGKQDSIISLVSNQPIACLDNADEKIEWLPDILARTSSGSKISKRRLWTTNDLAEWRTGIDIMITARNPQWARDDVIDRTIPIRTGRVVESEFIPEPEIYGPLDERREEILSEMMAEANKMLGKLLSSKTSKCITRIAEFEDFARRTQMLDEGTIRSLGDMQGELEAEQEDELVTILVFWFMSEHTGRSKRSMLDATDPDRVEILTSKLFKSLKNIALTNDLAFSVKNSQSLGSRLRTIVAALKLAGIEVRKNPHSSEGSKWTFRKVSSERSSTLSPLS